PMAGMNMRVMGLQELVRELRDQVESLYEQYDMDAATSELEQQLDDILDREQEALRARHGFESLRMNDFLDRRHGEDQNVGSRIERMRDHDFEDRQAGEDFQELLDELERIQQLDDFLERRGDRFRGSEQADYETAQEIRERIEALEQMARNLQEGNLESISPEQLQDLLGDPAAQSFVLLRDLESELENAGYLRGGPDPELTPRAIRAIGANALADVYTALRKGMAGQHDTNSRGVGLPRPDETRPWEFGDDLDLDIVRTVMNGVQRRTGEGQTLGSSSVSLEVADFEVREMDYTTQTTTILLLDMSWSMSWAGRFPAAKRVALAMDQLIRSSFPRDHFGVVGFSTQAREISIRELPEVSWDVSDPFTNLQDGLRVAERLIRQFPCSSPQIIVITDGQPTAYFEPTRAGEQLRVEWPSGFGGISPHAVVETLKQVRRVTKQGITINTFMLDDAPELLGFVEQMTQINRGRAFYTSPSQLGSFLMVDYISHKKLRRR
ncbi:MAG: VWA domain-containing protein, partial [Myxococcota bacterium]